MTRKDFQVIAESIRKARKACPGEYEQAALDEVTWNLADRLRKVNDQFDQDKFVEACKATPSYR